MVHQHYELFAFFVSLNNPLPHAEEQTSFLAPARIANQGGIEPHET